MNAEEILKIMNKSFDQCAARPWVIRTESTDWKGTISKESSLPEKEIGTYWLVLVYYKEIERTLPGILFFTRNYTTETGNVGKWILDPEPIEESELRESLLAYAVIQGGN